MYKTYLLLGSNVGDRIQWLAFARIQVERHIGVLVAVSRLYESAPWGLTDQRAFLNQALCVSTLLDPGQLLNEISLIEAIADRQRDQRWGPRTLDIDILFYENLSLDTEDLQIPHPRLTERNFALLPLCEIAPDLVHPMLELPVSELVRLSPDQSEVSILASS